MYNSNLFRSTYLIVDENAVGRIDELLTTVVGQEVLDQIASLITRKILEKQSSKTPGV
jgi:hypothetical protein